MRRNQAVQAADCSTEGRGLKLGMRESLRWGSEGSRCGVPCTESAL